MTTRYKLETNDKRKMSSNLLKYTIYKIQIYNIDPLHACINAASPKTCTSLHNAQHTQCIELYMKTHSEIAHQYGAFKIFLMMSGEMGQYNEKGM